MGGRYPVSTSVDLHLEESQRVFCANCIHCKVVREERTHGCVDLRVRCSAGKWRKKLGDQKTYKFFTVVRRSVKACDSYEEMGETKDFLRELRRSLPTKDESNMGVWE